MAIDKGYHNVHLFKLDVFICQKGLIRPWCVFDYWRENLIIINNFLLVVARLPKFDTLLFRHSTKCSIAIHLSWCRRLNKYTTIKCYSRHTDMLPLVQPSDFDTHMSLNTIPSNVDIGTSINTFSWVKDLQQTWYVSISGRIHYQVSYNSTFVFLSKLWLQEKLHIFSNRCNFCEAWKIEI